MIVDALESFVVFGTAAALVGFAALWTARRAGTRPRWTVALCTAVVALPPVAAAWLVVASLLPLSWMTEPEVRMAHGDWAHSSHLVGNLTAGGETLAYAILGLVALSALVSAWSTTREHRRLAWILARLEIRDAAVPAAATALVRDVARRHGLDVAIIQSDHPFSFVWGFRHSKLIVSTGLFTALTPAELTGVLAHEGAHHARRDNLVKLILTVCSHATLATPLARRMLRWRNEQVELLCDEAAAATSSPLDIAEALVKLRRRAPAATLATPGASGFLPDDDRGVERRVRRLVALADRSADRTASVAPPHASVAVTMTSLFALSLIAVAAWAPFAVHVAAESILQALK